MASQDKLATLSTNSRHLVVAGATHDSLIAAADGATAVSQAIHDVVVSVRTLHAAHRPLSYPAYPWHSAWEPPPLRRRSLDRAAPTNWSPRSPRPPTPRRRAGGAAVEARPSRSDLESARRLGRHLDPGHRGGAGQGGRSTACLPGHRTSPMLAAVSRSSGQWQSWIWPTSRRVPMRLLRYAGKQSPTPMCSY
jgi:hypothetical protein